MYELIVFDLDGTLLDTLQDLTDAVNVSLSKNGGGKRTEKEVRSFLGDGMRILVKRALGEDYAQHWEQAVADFSAYYTANSANKTKPYEGIIELLKELKNRRIKTAVLSNKPDNTTKRLSERFFEGLMTEAVGENECMGIRKKPAPDALFSLLERLGVEKEKTVYVGDSEVDIQTAQNAGVACISVSWGFRDKEFLAENGATVFVDTPMDILKLIEVK